MSAPSPDHVEAWLSQWPTWMLLLGAFFLLVAAVRVLNVLLDRIFPPRPNESDLPVAPLLDPEEGDDPWRWT